MQIFLFIVSYIFLSIIGPLVYVGLLLLSVRTMKKVFKMDEKKWSYFFSYRTGKGMYYFLTLLYLLMVAIMIPISIFWFQLIQIENTVVASISIIVILTLMGVVKFPKIKRMIKDKYVKNPL